MGVFTVNFKTAICNGHLLVGNHQATVGEFKALLGEFPH